MMLGALLGSSDVVHAQAGYTFTVMADMGPCFTSSPAINNTGAVAFVEGCPAPSGFPSSRVRRTDGTTLETLDELIQTPTERPGFLQQGGVSFNDAGKASFIVVDFDPDDDPNTGDARYWLRTADGTTVATLVDSTVDGFLGLVDSAINNAGDVAFQADLLPGGGKEAIYIHRAGTNVLIAAPGMVLPHVGTIGSAIEPHINDAGVVAFVINGSTASALVTSNGTSFNFVATNTGSVNGTFSSSWNPINNHGAVAFVGGPPDGVQVGSGGPFRTVATRAGNFSEISIGAINDAGTVAFAATTSLFQPCCGIFVGPNPVTDKVIAPGDAIAGLGTVETVAMHREAINNNGQIAFIVQYRATPGGPLGNAIVRAEPPPPPACSYALAPPTATVASDAGTTGVTLTTSGACTWTAETDVPWLTITSGGASGSGTQTFTLSFTANSEQQPRTATFTAGGQTVSITQNALNCSYTLTPPTVAIPGVSGTTTVVLTASAGCLWNASTSAQWLTITAGGTAGTGNQTFTLAYTAHQDPQPRVATFNAGGQVVTVTQSALLRQYFAEGATGSFFDTRIALLNPTAESGPVELIFQTDGGQIIEHTVTLGPNRRATLDPKTIVGLESANFSTVVESPLQVVADRTMTWNATGYGSHADTSISAPSTIWYLAEGSTSGDFALYYLLQNPNPTSVEVNIRYLRSFGLPPIDVPKTLGPNSRTTISVDAESPDLASTDMSAVITASAPIIAERAMYFSRPGQLFAAGHESAGVTSPATNWFLAEGATGPFFDLFILLANPATQAADVTIDFLLSTGTTHSKTYAVPALSRVTIWVDEEQIPANSGLKPLDNVAVSSTISSTNGVPIVVERVMWWPSPALGPNFWTEAHNSPGATTTGTRWALAEGELGGPQNAETYVLIANTSTFGGSARVTLFFEDGTAAQKVVDLLPRSRTNVAVSTDFPQAVGRRFGALVESLGASPAQLVVERAMYTSPGGVTWAAGTNSLATRLP